VKARLSRSDNLVGSKMEPPLTPLTCLHLSYWSKNHLAPAGTVDLSINSLNCTLKRKTGCTAEKMRRCASH
jgi:hypothetical protein